VYESELITNYKAQCRQTVTLDPVTRLKLSVGPIRDPYTHITEIYLK